jgi:hypothetical protein
MVDEELAFGLDMIKEYIIDSFEKPAEIPFGYNGTLYKISKNPGWYGLTFDGHAPRIFLSLDDAFEFVRKN